MFLANPNNPTGTIYSRDEWEDFLAVVPPQVLIVADDAYADYVEDSAYPDSLAYQRRGRLLLTLRTFSKIYGLAGLRIGYGVGPLEVISVLNRIRQPFNVNSLASGRCARSARRHRARRAHPRQQSRGARLPARRL